MVPAPMRTVLASLPVLFAAALPATAQTWSYPLDPRRTFLRTNGDNPLPQLLPNVWLGNLFVLQFGIVPATAGWTDSWLASTPGGLGGVSLIVQGAVLNPQARNGVYETTNAHRFVF